MNRLRHELVRALEELEDGDEEEAHELVEQHLQRALKMRQALDTIRSQLDDHIDHLDSLALLTREPDPDSIREAIEETRSMIDEDEALEEELEAFEQAFDDHRS